MFDAVLPLLNTFARVPVCGLIAHYNATELPGGVDRVPLLMRQVLVKRLTLRGFIVFDFASQQPDFWPRSARWYATAASSTAKISSTGWRNAPRALIGLLQGENFGKVIVRVRRRTWLGIDGQVRGRNNQFSD